MLRYIFLSVFAILLLTACGDSLTGQAGGEEPVADASSNDLDNVFENTTGARVAIDKESTTDGKTRQKTEDVVKLDVGPVNSEVGPITTEVGNDVAQFLQRIERGQDATKTITTHCEECDLRRADLSGVDLIDVNLSGANLSGANLTHVDLKEANLTGANLTGADLTKLYVFSADLTGADLRGVTLTDAHLGGAILSEVNLSGVTISNTAGPRFGKEPQMCMHECPIKTWLKCIAGSRLSTVGLFVVPENYCNTHESDWVEMRADGLDLTGVDLTGANLTNATLIAADLTETDLTGADLTGANLTNAYLGYHMYGMHGANLTNATLTRADFHNAFIEGVIGADWSDAHNAHISWAALPCHSDGRCYR